MYNRDAVKKLAEFISDKDGIRDKSVLADQVQKCFELVRDRSVFFGKWFAVRFCKAASFHFSNTVLSLSALHKYDDIPFIVCLVTPSRNYLLLANSTFLRKISHSSQELRMDNMKGSFNGSDIMRELEGISNTPANFEELFSIHENYTFEENLERLVEATNNIAPTGKRFIPSTAQTTCIMESVDRAISFMESDEYRILEADLSERVHAAESEIVIAAFIENVNLRGRIIEYLITAENDLQKTLRRCLRTNQPLPELYTADELGDYAREFEQYHTETDIKTKILFLSSNPKGYNIDKLLSFLSEERSVYLIYIVAIDRYQNIHTRLCSFYDTQLLSGTRIMKHWAGRNSRGVTQYDGRALEAIVSGNGGHIDFDEARSFIEDLMRG